MKDKLLDYLKVQPLARMRSNKDRAIVNILLNEYPELASADKNILIEFVKAHNSLDRSWRQALEQNPNLRGSDYYEKENLMKSKRLELGYKA